MRPKTTLFCYENLVLVLMGLAFGLVFFDRTALSFLTPFFAPELHLNNTEIGMLSSGLALTWAIAGYSVGALSDYLGNRKWLLVFAVAIFSLSSIASGVTASFLTLLATRVVMGAAEGPVLPLAQSIMAAESSEHRRGFNMGALQNLMSALLSYFAAPIALVAIAEAIGWRSSFFIAGAPGIVVAVLIALFIREPRHAGDPAGGSRGTIGIGTLLGYRNIWVCTILSCLMISWLIIQLAFLPNYLVQARGYSPQTMSFVVSALGISSALSAVIVPALSDRYGRRPIMAIFCAVGVVSPLAAIYFTGPLAAMIVVMGIGYFAIGPFSLLMATVPSETIPTRYVATALGLIMGVGELAGGFAGPTLAGIAADATGASAPMWIAAILVLGAAAVSLLLDETAPRVVGKLAAG